MKTLRNKYPYGINDRARDEETNELVGLQFQSVSKGAARTARSRTTAVHTANTAYAIFEQVYLVINNDIKMRILMSVKF